MVYKSTTAKSLLLLFILLFSVSLFNYVRAFDFEVGGDDGWAVPPAKDPDMYNDWASKNRFQVDDTIHFKYKKDSVMVVREEDYKKCRSTHPIFFSNNGATLVKLDRSGLFYFISGVAGHCERGQKMIIKVMGHSDGPGASPGGNQTGTPPPPGAPDSGVAGPDMARVLAMASVQLVLVLVGSIFF
ncbi:mavicyanin-like isoform X1 [Ananas comosus]|uniref:Mavicyanin-like isoform X1 n=2 Tax=Ananas comosus TaxID=4615 RepID=A0A6P5EA75_ANACO|nr:mavicyanin-like isoform X1 [Ananas comosus]